MVNPLFHKVLSENEKCGILFLLKKKKEMFDQLNT